jgi:glycerol-3-phosphate dehydrogenase
MNLEKKTLKNHDISCEIRENILFLNGTVETYDEWVQIGLKTGSMKDIQGVVNLIEIKNSSFQKDYKKRMEQRKKIFEKQKNNPLSESDIVIIGGGVIGCFIARELSKYENKTILLEKHPDVGLEATRANNGMIHPGISPSYKTLKRKLNIKGNQAYTQICKDLDVRFRRSGSLILITPRTLKKYKKYLPLFYKFILKHILPFFVKRKGIKNGIKNIKIIKNEKIFDIEPQATKDTIAAVHIPTTGILDPYDLTIALAENATKNNVEIKTNHEVVGFLKENNKITAVVTNQGTIKCKLVINAAGVYADEIADLAGSREYTIHPRKGVELIFDKTITPTVNHCLAELTLPTHKTSKGGGVNPTVHKNIIWGPTAVEVDNKKDTNVSREEICMMLERYKTVVNQNFPTNKLIRYFAGIRAPTFTEDFIIRHAKWVDNMIHVAGIQSPGLASAPAIAEKTIKLVQQKNLAENKKTNFDPKRRGITPVSVLSEEQLKEKIKEDPAWGNIVCTCEMISEAEIKEAIKKGARSIDAIKRRTRAGMGVCQQSYCELRIAKILSKELNKPLNEIVKETKQSKLFNGRVRGES